jgi:hypothetical protein
MRSACARLLSSICCAGGAAYFACSTGSRFRDCTERVGCSKRRLANTPRARESNPGSIVHRPIRYTRSPSATYTSEYGSVPGKPLTTVPRRPWPTTTSERVGENS